MANKLIVTQEQRIEYEEMKKRAGHLGYRIHEDVESIQWLRRASQSLADRFDRHHNQQKINYLQERVNQMKDEYDRIKKWLKDNERLGW